MLACADQIEVLPFNLVHHVFHLGKAHHTVDNIAADHKRRYIISESAVNHKVARIGQNR